MEIGQLRALRELGDRGSISAVAATLRVTPSSVSQQISALQRSSPVPITHKVGRRTVLTDAGRALALAAVGVEVALERAEQAVQQFQDEPAGTVTIAAFHSAAMTIFPRLLEHALNDPQISVRDFDVAQSSFPGLTSDNDLVIAHRLLNSPPWPSSVCVEPLLFEPLDLAMRRDHYLAAKKRIEPADLRGEAWVAVHEGFPLEGAITQIATLGGAEARILHRVNEFFVAAAIVETGNCVALLPRYTTARGAHPNLVLKPIDLPMLGRHIDCLARPETLERTSVKNILARIRTIVENISSAR